MAEPNDKEEYYGYRLKIYPTPEQQILIDQFIDANRYGYNWALSECNLQEEKYNLDILEDNDYQYKYLSEYELDKRFTQHKKIYSLLDKIPISSYRSGIRRCVKAFKFYEQSISNHPVFHHKKIEDRDGSSVEIRADRTYFIDNYIYISGIGNILTKINTNYKKYELKLYNTIISRNRLHQYYFSYQIIREKPKVQLQHKCATIGIDLNVKKGFVLSNGKIYYRPDTSKLRNKIKDLESKCSKDRKRIDDLEKANPDKNIIPSKRSLKRHNLYLKKNKKLANIEENFIQTTTTDIIKKYYPEKIVMEDLKIEEWKSIHYIANKIPGTAFYRCREVMQYKANRYNIQFQLAAKDYPSSQICSCCGHRKKDYGDKIYICPICGMKIDRDINAAINLSRL